MLLFSCRSYSYALIATTFGWSFGFVYLWLDYLQLSLDLVRISSFKIKRRLSCNSYIRIWEIIRIILINWYEVTNGPDGITGIPRPSFFGLPFKRSPDEGELSFHTFGLEYSTMHRIIFILLNFSSRFNN